MARQLHGFLLTRDWYESPEGLRFELWAATDEGPVHAVVTGQEAVCFVERNHTGKTDARRQRVDLKNFDGDPVDALYARTRRELLDECARLRKADARVFETDVAPLDRFLMERFVRGGVCFETDEWTPREGYIELKNPIVTASNHEPKLKIASIDIETEGLEGALYSIAVATREAARVFMVSDEPIKDFVEVAPDEAGILNKFFAWLSEYDPDLLIGWNVIDFDCTFLARRCKELGIAFRVGRGGSTGRIQAPRTSRQMGIARFPGRVVIDGIAMLRTAAYNFERFTLEYVAQELLSRGKRIAEGADKPTEIQRQFREDKASLAAYNVDDCRLVLDIFDKTHLIDFAIARSRLTGLSMERQGGSVAAFDFRYLPLLHRQGYVASDLDDNVSAGGSPGGYVMDSEPGLFENVLVLDFKSLYPSIIRTFKIDPLGMALGDERGILGHDGARFSRTKHVLPGLTDELHAAREEAKRKGDDTLSYAVKILMNSFYGVLGTTGCRFHHPKLASSVTTKGHEIITQTRDRIEASGYRVIYGDTDSVFVLVGPGHSEEDCAQVGHDLVTDLNAWWHERIAKDYAVESFLELELETHYLRFLMPTMRGSTKGTKKRYAGLTREADGSSTVVVRGLEAVRTDWTRLSRDFQSELLRRVFHDEPYIEYVQDVAEGVLEGRYDAQLIYRKRIRRPLAEYRDPGPPHVQAARKLGRETRRISYAITVNGPEPEETRRSALDYAHYLDRQLAPAADTVLQFLGTSFDELTARQLELFERRAGTE